MLILLLYFFIPKSLTSIRLLCHQKNAMLRCCKSVWHPPIIFIGTPNLALIETDSAKLRLLYEKMRAMDGWVPFYRYITYSSLAYSLHSFFAAAHLYCYTKLLSVVTRSLELCIVYGNRLTLLLGTYDTNGEKWMYIV
ncbi:hypothetical protein SFRURICE_017951 [Spodoptera frugiperda]|nr:hypothetical protein SFRURICE_017951 [Spodoptera frugiperda]